MAEHKIDVKIKGDSTSLNKALSGAEEQFKKVAQTSKDSSRTWETALGTAAGNLATGALSMLKGAFDGVVSKVSEVVSALAQVGDQADALGVSTQAFQALKQAADDAHQPLSELQGLFGKIQEAARQALAGDSDVAGRLAGIGVAVEDLKGKSPEEIFATVASALASLGAAASDNQDAVKLFGAGVGGLTGALQQYVDLKDKGGGDFFDEQSIRSAQELAKSMAELKTAIMYVVGDSGFIAWLGDVVKGLRDIQTAKKLVEGQDYIDPAQEANQKRSKTQVWAGRALDAVMSVLPGVSQYNFYRRLSGKPTLGALVTGKQEEGVNVSAQVTGQDIVDKRQSFYASQRGQELQKQQQDAARLQAQTEARRKQAADTAARLYRQAHPWEAQYQDILKEYDSNKAAVGDNADALKNAQRVRDEKLQKLGPRKEAWPGELGFQGANGQIEGISNLHASLGGVRSAAGGDSRLLEQIARNTDLDGKRIYIVG